MNKETNAKKILIIRFGAIGDVVHSSIIQKAIKAKHPEAQVHFMTSDYIEPILKRDENLSKTYGFDMKKKDNLFYLLKLGLEFRKEKYDYVINLQNSLRNQFLSFLSGAEYVQRGKVNLKHSTDAFFQSAQNIFGDLEKPTQVDLFLEDKTPEKVKARLGSAPRPYVVFSPAGDHDKFRRGRIWSFENWNELGRLVKEKFGGSIFIIGSKSEGELHKEFINIDGAKIFSGELTLDESIHLFSMADLFVSGDSGPLHMATAVRAKTVGLFGSTSSSFCAPYGSNGYIIDSRESCRPCSGKDCPRVGDEERFTPCMNEISPQRVVEFISEKNLLN